MNQMMLVAYDEPSSARVNLILERIVPHARLYTAFPGHDTALPFPAIDLIDVFLLVAPPFTPVMLTHLESWRRAFPLMPLVVIGHAPTLEQETAWLARGADEVLDMNSLSAVALERGLTLAIQRGQNRGDANDAGANYFNLFEESPIPQWIYDAKTYRFLLVNKSAIKRYGYSRSEFESMKITDIRSGRERQRMLEHIAVMNRNQGQYLDSGTWVHRSKTGEQFYVKIYSRPIVFKGCDARIVLVIDTNEKELARQQNAELAETLKVQMRTMDVILNTIENGVWVNTPGEQTLRYCNRAFEKITGYTQEELNASPGLIRNACHPDDLPRLEEAMSRLQQHDDVRFEFRLTRKDGTRKVLLCSAITAPGDDEGKMLVYGSLVDITSLRKYEKAIDTQNKVLADIMDRISDVFFTLDRNWHFTYVNRRFEERFNLEGNRLMGKYCWRFLDEDNIRLLKPALQKVLDENRKIALQVFYEPIKIWLNITAYPTRDGVAVYCTDITTIMQQTQQLNHLHKNQSALINCTHDMIWSIDNYLNLISFNEAFEKTVLELIGIRIREGMQVRTNLFGEEEESRWRGYYARALNGESFRMELPFTLAHNGQKIYTEMIFNPIRHGNEIIGVGCFGRDITRQVLQQQRIARQLQHLRDISWQQSHVVRAPLARLMGLIHVLKVCNTPEEVAHYLELLFETAAELDKVIQDTVKLADSDR
jgi:PAS domain S-box-containing protein